MGGKDGLRRKDPQSSCLWDLLASDPRPSRVRAVEHQPKMRLRERERERERESVSWGDDVLGFGMYVCAQTRARTYQFEFWFVMAVRDWRKKTSTGARLPSPFYQSVKTPPRRAILRAILRATLGQRTSNVKFFCDNIEILQEEEGQLSHQQCTSRWRRGSLIYFSRPRLEREEEEVPESIERSTRCP